MVLLDVAAPVARPVGRWLLTLLAGVLYGLGWTVGRAVAGVVGLAVWSVSLVALGWHEARQPRAG